MGALNSLPEMQLKFLFLAFSKAKTSKALAIHPTVASSALGTRDA